MRHFFILGFHLLAFVFPLSAGNQVIRIMAANTTSGNGQDYQGGHGTRIFQGLDPAIALVQEMNYKNNTPADLREWVNLAFGPTFQYFCEPSEQIPNGIVSSYPILEAGEWPDSKVPNRDYVWARIDIPGDKDLWAISVHFYTQSSGDRAAEANEVKAAIATKGIPATDYIVLGGDFNTGTRGEACISNLSTVFVTSSPYPADGAGNGNTNASRAKPYDWVLANPALDARETQLVIGSNTFPNGLVFDSRVYSPLSEVAPVQQLDSDATNMQHMAVMRAFLIPMNEPPVIAQGTVLSRSISQNNHPSAFAAALTASDPDGNPLAWDVSTAASHGNASIAAPATGGSVSLRYTPANDYVGSDSFIIRVSDGHGGIDTIQVQIAISAAPAFDAWTYEHFAPLAPANEANVWGEMANPDGDDYTNLEEFAFGLVPTLKDDTPNPLQIMSGSSPPVLSFLIRMDGGAPALSYQIERSLNFAALPWTLVPQGEYVSLGESTVDANFKRRSIQFTSPPQDERRFYRVRITR